jgi:dihydroorotase
LETELPLALGQLYHTGRMELSAILAKFTTAPARLLGLEKGTLKVGVDADLTVFDPELEWVYSRESSLSKSRNSPFDQWPLKGKALATVVGGKIVWREDGFGGKVNEPWSSKAPAVSV